MPTIEQIRAAADVLERLGTGDDAELREEALGIGFNTWFDADSKQLNRIADFLEEKSNTKVKVVVDNGDEGDLVVRVKFGDRQVAVYLGDNYRDGVFVNDSLHADVGGGSVVWSNSK